MLTDSPRVHLYDGREGVQHTHLDDPRIRRRSDDQLLWIDLVGADDAILGDTAAIVGQTPTALRRMLNRGQNGAVDDQGDVVAVHGFTLDRDGDGYQRDTLDIAAGQNWVVTLHAHETDTIDEFRHRLETSRRVGGLDGGSFVAFLADWMFTHYMAEIDRVDVEIDNLDVSILRSSGDRDSLESISDLRRRVAAIRQALAAHREIVSWPAHIGFSDVMTESAQRHFAASGARFAEAMASADTTRDSLAGSFDLLMSRVAQRTNDTVRVLTVVSVSLLPATLVTGVLGMNFHPSFFDHPTYFWFTVAAIALVVVCVLVTARRLRWV